MAVCLKARPVQSDLPAADKRTRFTRLVPGKDAHKDGTHKVRTRYAQGTHKAAHKVPLTLCKG